MNKRFWELDALRGLMLVLMTLTHLPTRLTAPTGQPFGYVSAAEGFVLLSAFMAGMVYGRRSLRDGLPAMRDALWQRAGKIYVCHALMLLFLFTVVAALAVRIGQPGAVGLMRYFLENPFTGWFASLALIYMPPLLDILPIYVLFMLASPLLLSHGLRHGWGAILSVSVLFWLGAQFGIGDWLYDTIAVAIGLSVPLNETGSFSIWAWQLIWVMGLWLGASLAQGRAQVFALPRWSVTLAVALALTFLVWRHVVGQVPFAIGSAGNLWFDKWTLGPLRMINLFALLAVALHFGPRLAAYLPRPRFLITLGQASLPVFCAHLVIVLLVLATMGGAPDARPWWGDALLLAACFGTLHAVARISQWHDRQRAARRAAAAAVPAEVVGPQLSPALHPPTATLRA
ncbi:OpgC domain-containing protein [Corticibacter populi]|uniref:OpgC domain-containing protein n=1 Tax=Corticibacter populi TaxID=1550736 RepID=A0A3M6QKM2_9BURK|nr:OpgC domain-containing protein [Corticibacter populi]RMX03485.1 OpgC domain-containing protein [Corticibacter populi]RZS29925.1 hypothetical protein EV687_3410 [Corticibacter populi]